MNDRNRKSSVLFTPSGCLTGDTLMLFVSGSLKDSDLQSVQQHIVECPLCADAADGLKIWLKEQTPDQPDSIKSSAGTSSETSGLSGESNIAKGYKSNFPGSYAYKFHTRTEKINERVKQRLNFHKQVDAARHKRRQIKPYAWIGVAATIVLFIGIYYAVQVQKTFNKQTSMQESTHDEMVLPSGDQNKADGPDSIHLESPALALKVEEHSARKRSSEIHKTLPVIHTDEISADMNIINTDETSPETLADAEKFDTSISTNNNPPAETGGIVISAYKVPMEKKSLGYVVTEEKPVQEIDGVVVKKSKRTENQEKDSEELIFTVVEQMPEYPGGQEKMLEFLSENLKYPDSAKESGIQGSVYVSFEVRKDGRISDVKVLKGIGGGCDEEAIRLVNLMPHWKPGRQNGKTVKTRFTMPVNFKLQQ